MREFRTAWVERFHDWNQFSSSRCAGHRRYGEGSGKLTFTGIVLHNSAAVWLSVLPGQFWLGLEYSYWVFLENNEWLHFDLSGISQPAETFPPLYKFRLSCHQVSISGLVPFEDETFSPLSLVGLRSPRQNTQEAVVRHQNKSSCLSSKSKHLQGWGFETKFPKYPNNKVSVDAKVDWCFSMHMSYCVIV